MLGGSNTPINKERFNDPAVVKNYASLQGPTPCEKYYVQKYLKIEDHVLELGIGGGRLVDFLKSRSKVYVGVDNAEKMIEAAKARFPTADLRVMDAMDLSAFPHQSLDVVVFSMNGIDCLPSLEGRAQCIGEVHRVLKPGGYFIFSSHHARGIVHWPEMNTDLKRKLWRVIRSSGLSLQQFTVRIFSPVFWKGSGFTYDPADGGLKMFYSNPAFIQKEVVGKGFDLVEIKSTNFPRPEPLGITIPAYMYGFRKT